MNQKKTKRIRRQVKKSQVKLLKDFIGDVNEMKFIDRLKFAIRIIRGA